MKFTTEIYSTLQTCLRIKKLPVPLCLLACISASSVSAADYSVSGQLDTILRLKTDIYKKNIYPLYEYVRLAASNNQKDGSGIDFYLGAWGRVDTAEKSGEKNRDGDLQYAYLTYRAAKNNTVVNLGRQFVTDGVAAEQLDGLYVRSDFYGGTGASAFIGKPVIIEPKNSKNYGSIIYGGRISQSMPKYYTVGLSALKSDTEANLKYREEIGADLWLHPIKQIDVTGRSSYNSITKGWMEQNYTISAIPFEQVRISGEFSNINYRDYFYNMTTPIFSFANRPASQNIARDEKLTTTGVSASYSPFNHLTFSGDYKHYAYKVDGKADYFGGKIVHSLPESFSLGCAIHRMAGQNERLRYTEYRLFASKKIGLADLAIDINNTGYDTRINGVRNSYAVTGSAGYEFGHRLKIGADVEYSKNPDFDNEVRGLIKLTYLFDTKKQEGRSNK